MKREDIPVLEFVAVLAMVVLAITVATLFFPRDKVGDMATWAGAIGAFLAFGGTIWIATGETRRRERQELLQARLHAASMIYRLTHAEAMVKIVCGKLEIRANGDKGVESLMACSREIKEINIWAIKEVVPLSPLPNNLAVDLAAAADQLDVGLKIFEKSYEMLRDGSASEREKFARDIRNHLIETSELLEKSIVECQRAYEAVRAAK